MMLLDSGCEPYRDEFDRPTLKTPESHPLEYDGFVLWHRREFSFTDKFFSLTTIDLRIQDYWRFVKLSHLHFGGEYAWDTVSPYAIEAFMREWLDNQKLILSRLMQFCDERAMPYWRVDCL